MSLDSGKRFEFDRAGAAGDQFVASRQVVLTTLRPLSLRTLPTSSWAPGVSAGPAALACMTPIVGAATAANAIGSGREMGTLGKETPRVR